MPYPADNQSVSSIIPTDTGPKWHYASGPLPISMTNDYLFRALLQRNNHVLKGLICSLLHLSPQEVSTAAINNPIILGESISNKTFFLDISVTLNDHALINLEMQVINEHNWPERSLSYLCRTFDNLNSGENYAVVRPAIQIGLLNFTLFPMHPEFYATYQFTNIKNHTIYSDKIRLSVLNLTRIDLATEEDKQYHLDCWASLFKAATWEELKMYAKQDELINDASDTVYQLSQDKMIRLQCEAREDYYRRQRSVQHQIEILNRENASLKNENTSLQNENFCLKEEIASLRKQISDALQAASLSRK